WLCTTCFTCSERCPQEVDPANIIFSFTTLYMYLKLKKVSNPHKPNNESNIQRIMFVFNLL
ncbi:MAG: hypothetical protein ABGF52_12815, partial [Candidatus Asgardarchaeum sp.]